MLDNPFLGLDIEGRSTLHDIINKLALQGIQLLLITNSHELPLAITHVARLDRGRWTYKGDRSGFHPDDQPATATTLDAGILQKLRVAASVATSEKFDFAIRMVNTTIRYGGNTILQGINWAVKQGERWNVSGPNGGRANRPS